ncbi:hypothetical protein QF002_007373 [Paraburkholderia youngii]
MLLRDCTAIAAQITAKNTKPAMRPARKPSGPSPSKLVPRSLRERHSSMTFSSRFASGRLYRILRRRRHDPLFERNNRVILGAITVHDKHVIGSAQHRP